MKTFWTRCAQRWDRMHVERHGNYSVERLYSLKAYSERTSLVRVVLVVVLTTLPCLTAVIAADLIPLEPPSKGIAHSHMFWVRVFFVSWYITFTILSQCRQFMVRLPMHTSPVFVVRSVSSMSESDRRGCVQLLRLTEFVLLSI